MMAGTMTDGWGERRAAEREARMRRRAQWIVACGAGAAFGAPFMAGFVDGFLQRPVHPVAPWFEAAGLVIFIGIALALVGRGWRDLDEVQRQRFTTLLAMLGLLNLVLRPVLLLIGPQFGVADPQHEAWVLSLIGAVILPVIADAWERL